jgi:predicted P-loop ATPase
MSSPKERMTIIDGGKGGAGRKRGGGGTSPDDWRRDLVYASNGDVKGVPHNVLLALDEFANRVALSRDPPWIGASRDEFTEADGLELSAWLGSPHRYRMSVGADLVMSSVEAIARRNRFHPVRSYLRGLEWDGVERIARMFPDRFGGDDSAYTRDAAKCFMVSAVARILWIDPLVATNGAQVDFMLVLEGPQGVRKTSAVRTLFGAQWYAEAMESPASKDFYQALRGRWGVEIGEMDSFGKADVTKVKQAITSRFDVYRPSYGRYPKTFRRECVFVGTTNENEYLRDATGGRRFLPVRVSGVDIAGIAADRDQLWAEAVQLFDAGHPWWKLPAAAAAEQADRYAEDSWADVIVPWLRGKGDEKNYPSRLGAMERTLHGVEWTTTTEILSWALRIDVGKHGRPEQMRVAAIMKHLGWLPERVTTGGSRERRWRQPADGGPNDAPF